ncbi:glycogen debranching enzyme-like, partial [Actinia tenebrosa]|uniref:Glycogen debranching enzyme-like n=1 Tax=Actinia tenebrosa TaxID=6105 RepID=A0A6P8I9M4_ACTTE
VYVDQIHADVHAITRHCPDQRRTVVLVAHSAFKLPPDHLLPTESNMKVQMHGIPPLNIPGDIEEVIFEATLVKKNGLKEFKKDGSFINGLESHVAVIQENIPIQQSKVLYIPAKIGSVLKHFRSNDHSL